MNAGNDGEEKVENYDYNTTTTTTIRYDDYDKRTCDNRVAALGHWGNFQFPIITYPWL